MSGAPVAVLGAGRMGRGIALACACAGRQVALIDARQRDAAAARELGAAALADIAGQLGALAELGLADDAALAPILARIAFSARADAAAALAPAGLVFEAVPERMEAKAEAFAFAAPRLAGDAVLASTSSTFLSTTLAAMVAAPARFLNAHWLNPAHLIPLVELSPHPGTDPQATGGLREALEAMGKVTVLCGASPGYIVPRLQSLVMNEAARMIEQGVASAADIDRATRYGFGIRYAAMGVVEFIDVGGNDILYYASRYLAEALADPRYASPGIVGRHMAEGRNGLRDGRGFHDWRAVDAADWRRRSTARLVELLRIAGCLPRIV